MNWPRRASPCRHARLRELRARHTRHFQDLLRLGVQLPELQLDQLLQARRHRRRIAPGGLARGRGGQPAAAGELLHHMDHEERMPLGAPVHPRRPRGRRRLGGPALRQVGLHRRHRQVPQRDFGAVPVQL